MYASIRRYHVTSPAEFTQHAKDEFLPLIREVPGFVAYYGIDAGNGVWISVSVFETGEQAEESNARAATFVHEHLSGIIRESSEITAGELVVSQT